MFFEYLDLLIHDYTLRTISLGTVIMGMICGSMGCFAMLRKQSLLGDAISHAALPGIALVFLILGTKNTFGFLLGAIASGVLATLWLGGIRNNTRLKTDTGLGIVLSVFFGLGIVLLTYIQKLPNANQAGLDSFLFGQAATLVMEDIVIMSIFSICILLIVGLFWKEFKLLSFDMDFAKSMGFKVKLLDVLLTSTLVVAIVLGLQTVGVVLMSSLLLAPAAAARQWTNKLEHMFILSSIFGGLSGLIGTGISAMGKNLSTGPLIVLVAIVIVTVSFVFAPKRGLISKYYRQVRLRQDLKIKHLSSE